MCVYVYVYESVCMCSACTCVGVHVHLHVPVRVCMCMWASVCYTCKCITCTHIHKYTHTGLHAYIVYRIWICTYTYHTRIYLCEMYLYVFSTWAWACVWARVHMYIMQSSPQKGPILRSRYARALAQCGKHIRFTPTRDWFLARRECLQNRTHSIPSAAGIIHGKSSLSTQDRSLFALPSTRGRQRMIYV